MKSSLWIAIAVLLILISAGASAQNNTFKVKSSITEKAPRSTVAVPEKMSGTGNSAAKNLQNIERESAKSVAPSPAKKTGTPSAVKPIKEESNPPINFSGKSQAKQGGMINQGPNPYKGRLKEKGAQRQ